MHVFFEIHSESVDFFAFDSAGISSSGSFIKREKNSMEEFFSSFDDFSKQCGVSVEDFATYGALIGKESYSNIRFCVLMANLMAFVRKKKSFSVPKNVFLDAIAHRKFSDLLGFGSKFSSAQAWYGEK